MRKQYPQSKFSRSCGLNGLLVIPHLCSPRYSFMRLFLQVGTFRKMESQNKDATKNLHLAVKNGQDLLARIQNALTEIAECEIQIKRLDIWYAFFCNEVRKYSLIDVVCTCATSVLARNSAAQPVRIFRIRSSSSCTARRSGLPFRLRTTQSESFQYRRTYLAMHGIEVKWCVFYNIDSISVTAIVLQVHPVISSLFAVTLLAFRGTSHKVLMVVSFFPHHFSGRKGAYFCCQKSLRSETCLMMIWDLSVKSALHIFFDSLLGLTSTVNWKFVREEEGHNTG